MSDHQLCNCRNKLKSERLLNTLEDILFFLLFLYDQRLIVYAFYTQCFVFSLEIDCTLCFS